MSRFWKHSCKQSAQPLGASLHKRLTIQTERLPAIATLDIPKLITRAVTTFAHW